MGDLYSDHHGDGSLPPKAPWRGWVRRVGGRGDEGRGVGNGAVYHPSLNQNAAVVNRRFTALAQLAEVPVSDSGTADGDTRGRLRAAREALG